MNKKSNKINKINKKSNKMLKNKTLKNKKGGTTIYYMDTSKIRHPDITYKGSQFFRKVYNIHPTEEQNYLKKVEKSIVKILMKHPNPNIVKYYKINYKYVNMEEVNTLNLYHFFNEVSMTSKEIIELQEVMRSVKDFLQGLGIMYVDWKFDNIGKSSIDNKYKLFDFDASGIIDLVTKKWKLKPIERYWSYKTAIQNGAKTPKEIDDWSFHHNIIEEGNKIIGELAENQVAENQVAENQVAENQAVKK